MFSYFISIVKSQYYYNIYKKKHSYFHQVQILSMKIATGFMLIDQLVVFMKTCLLC
jgi:hypothetical protein